MVNHIEPPPPIPLPSGGRVRSGFTLIEVVVALAILGVGLMVIIELFSGGLRLGRASKEYTNAVNYARMKMEEVRLKPPTVEGTEEGEFDDLFRWQVDVKKVNILPVEKGTDFKPPAELFLVKVNVIWRSGSKERSVGLQSYQIVKQEESEKI
jgi:prepilin-type N-terminal cleavage/methylation domain-containing protein